MEQEVTLKRVDLEDSTMRRVWHLRYDVYCVEKQFLDAAGFPDGLERDEFDDYAVQFVAVNEENRPIATLRLVRDGPHGFPLEQHTSSLFPAFYDLPRHKMGEISRLIVSKDYRERTTSLSAALFRVALVEGLQQGRDYALAAMEPALCRHLKRFGYPFVPIGEPMEYGGRVLPYVMNLDD